MRPYPMRGMCAEKARLIDQTADAIRRMIWYRNAEIERLIHLRNPVLTFPTVPSTKAPKSLKGDKLCAATVSLDMPKDMYRCRRIGRNEVKDLNP